MKKVYICHAYKNDPKGNEKNVAKICRAIKDQVEYYYPSFCTSSASGLGFTARYLPVAPQIYLNKFLSERTERAKAMEYCISLVNICNELWIFGPITAGMRKEIAHAHKKYIPIRKMALDKDGKIQEKPKSKKSHFIKASNRYIDLVKK